MPFDPQDELVRAAPSGGTFKPPEGDELVRPAQRLTPSGGLSGGRLPEPERGQRGGQGLEDLARGAADLTKDQLRLADTHYRLLGSAVGLTEKPSEEELEEYNEAVVEMAGTAAGAGVFGLGSKALKAVMRAGGRGASIAGTRRFLADQARHVVPTGSRPTANIVKELAKPAGVGIATEAIVDFSDPTTSEFWDQLVSIPAGFAAGGAVSQSARADLLVQNPRFREWAMRASRAGLPSRVIGGLVGHYLARAGNEAVNTGQDAMERLSVPEALRAPTGVAPAGTRQGQPR